jgi:excisionase family DNA binding protein
MSARLDPTPAKNGVELVDYEGASQVLRCTPRLVRKLVEERKLDSVKVGRLVRIELSAIDRFVERNRREALT